jgi:peptidyl-prolyl cis-trans isomerase SurA
MKKFLISLSIFLIFFSNNSQAEKQIIAKVNNKIITSFEVADRYKFVIFASKIEAANEEEKRILISQIIDKMIDEELIRQEAKQLNIAASNDELKNALEIVALQYKQNPTQFKLELEKNKISFNNYLKQLETEILWSKIISQILRAKVKINDFEVKEFLEQNHIESDVRSFFLAEILISSEVDNAKKLAEKLVVELENGANFKNIVKQFSSAISSENNGEIGWVSAKDVNKKIYEAIAKLSKNSYSQPVQLEDGFHIFKLIDAKVEEKIPDQYLNAAKNAIFSIKLQTAAKSYLIEMRKKSFIEKN